LVNDVRNSRGVGYIVHFKKVARKIGTINLQKTQKDINRIAWGLEIGVGVVFAMVDYVDSVD
jgi:hypothetical protein